MRRSAWLAAAVALCLLAGLVGSINASGDTRFRCVNGLGNWDIHQVHFSLSSNTNWGDDRLRSDQILSPGESETWDVDPGTYDLRAIDEDGDTYRRMGVCISEGMTVEWAVTHSERDVD